jgi:uncharacterized protein YjaZ
MTIQRWTDEMLDRFAAETKANITHISEENKKTQENINRLVLIMGTFMDNQEAQQLRLEAHQLRLAEMET